MDTTETPNTSPPERLPPKGSEEPGSSQAASSSGEPTVAIKTSYYLLMVYSALFGAGAALLAAAYISLYNWGVKFFAEPSHFGLSIGRFWIREERDGARARLC